MNAKQTTTEMNMKKYIIKGTRHDMGAKDQMRESDDLKDAEFTANLVRECGYQIVSIDGKTYYY